MLSYARLTHPWLSPDVRAALKLALDFLQNEAEVNPYAKQYRSILDDVSRGIQSHQEELTQRRRVSNGMFLDRMAQLRSTTQSESVPSDSQPGGDLPGFQVNFGDIEDLDTVSLEGWDNMTVRQFVNGQGDNWGELDSWLDMFS